MSIHLFSCQLFALAYLRKSSIHCFGSSLSFPENVFGRTKDVSLLLRIAPVRVLMNCSNCSPSIIPGIPPLRGSGVGTLGDGALKDLPDGGTLALAVAL